MERTKYTAEFKSEVVKKILDRGHSAVEVSSRLWGGQTPVHDAIYVQKRHASKAKKLLKILGWKSWELNLS